MPQSRSNKAQTPINSDAWNLVPDLATIADSLEVIVPVADRTEGDSVAAARAAAGWPISDARPLFVWNTATKTIEIKDSGGWRGPGRYTRHQAFLSSGFTVAGGLVSWDVGPLTNQTAEQVNGGFATAGPLSGQITINETGWYSLSSYSVPVGATANAAAVFMNRNNGGQIITVGSTTGSPAWEACTSMPRIQLNSGDVVRFVIITQTSRTWNTLVYIDKLDG